MSETRTFEIEEIRKSPTNIHVFISYSHDDFGIAQRFQDELINVNPDRVRCFLDAYNIRSGEEWHSTIIANLKAADWLIFLYTGRDRRPYDYCGFEIGIFTSVHHLDTSRKIAKSARLLCIHDTPTVPSLLSMVQNRRIRPYQSDGSTEASEEIDFYAESPLAQFFEDFYQYPAQMPLRDILTRTPGGGTRLKEMPNTRAEIAQRVKRIAASFQASRRNDPISEKFYQVRMEINIRDAAFHTKNEIPGSSIVTAAQDTFNLLGLSPDPDENGEIRTTWDQIRNSLVSNNETFAWMDKVEDDVIDAVNQRNLRSPESSFRANDNQFYRPLLARQIIYGSGARTFSVIFIRTLPRKFVGDENTSALLVGLILASRFRFAFIEGKEELLTKILGDSASDPEFQLACRQLIYDVERMEQESSEFGMNSPDLLQQAFGPGDHEVVNGFYELWFPARKALFAALKGRLADPANISRETVTQEVAKFSSTIEPVNRRFLDLCLQKYTVHLRQWLKRA